MNLDRTSDRPLVDAGLRVPARASGEPAVALVSGRGPARRNAARTLACVNGQSASRLRRLAAGARMTRSPAISAAGGTGLVVRTCSAPLRSSGTGLERIRRPISRYAHLRCEQAPKRVRRDTLRACDCLHGEQSSGAGDRQDRSVAKAVPRPRVPWPIATGRPSRPRRSSSKSSTVGMNPLRARTSAHAGRSRPRPSAYDITAPIDNPPSTVPAQGTPSAFGRVSSRRPRRPYVRWNVSRSGWPAARETYQ